MKNNNFQDELLQTGSDKYENVIKTLLYKQDKNIFDKIDFNNSEIYKEPLLFTFFNNLEKFSSINYEAFLSGYSPKRKNREYSFQIDKYGRAYLPNYGWLTSTAKEILVKYDSSGVLLLNENTRLKKKEYLIPNEIEIYSFLYEYLDFIYYDSSGKILNVEIDQSSLEFSGKLQKAYGLIKKYLPDHYSVIRKYASRCVIFSETTNGRNSFADRAAHGIAFYNAYQEEYDEIFFIDDIAHQTAHVLLSTIMFDERDFFKIPSDTVVDIFEWNNHKEERLLQVVYHALFTYKAIFQCLHHCSKHSDFDERQKLEILGRLKFYYNKCKYDLQVFNAVGINDKHNRKDVFSDEAYKLFKAIYDSYIFIHDTYHDKFKHIDVTGQPYNFTNKIFYEKNI